MLIDINKTAMLLKYADDVMILCHRSPDGDTVGSAMALYYALKQLGKRVAVRCADPLPAKFSYLYPEAFDEVSGRYVVAVDTASPNMLAALQEEYPSINMCIDHHPTNPDYAEYTLLQSDAAATGEIMAEVIEAMEIEVDRNIVNGLYTAIVSDTGCFRYASTTAKTFEIAAWLLKNGADNIKINQIIFETKPKALVKLEAVAAEGLQYYHDGIVAVMPISHSMISDTDVCEEDLDALASLPRNIEGVGIGITIKQPDANECRVSLRTSEPYDASKIATVFGGGGHKRAAGCRLKNLDLEQVIHRLVEESGKEIARNQQ